MNQPPGANNPWPPPPPAGAPGAGFTQLGEPPPEALRPDPAFGGGPMAGSKVAPTMADPGLGQAPYGQQAPYGAPAGYGPPPGQGPNPGYGQSPFGAPYGAAPAFTPAPRNASKGSSALPIILGASGLLVAGLAVAGFLFMRGRSEEPPPPVEVPASTPAPVAADPTPAPADSPAAAPADAPADSPPPVTPPPTPKPAYTAPPKPTTTTKPPLPKPTTTTTAKPSPTPKPTGKPSSGNKFPKLKF